jgi:hypothetical protein
MPISDHMAIEPIGGTFRAFGPPAVPVTTPTQPTGQTQTTPTQAGQLPSQATLDAIRQALAMITANDGSDTSTDGTDPSTASDPLAAILNTSDASTQTAPDAGSLGLDAFA